MKRPAADPSVQNLVDAYSGKSEQELLQALQGMSAEERAAMRTFARELAPMLNDAQKRRLDALLRQFGGQ